MGIIEIKGNNKEETYEVSNRIFTLPNLITFVRLCLIPVFAVLLFDGHDFLAALVFGITAATDFVDGQLARRTNSVSRLGQFLDPLVDRLLMITAVVALLIVGRLPLWLIILVIARDGFLLVGGAYILKHYHVRVAVIYLGKIATALLFIGCAFLLFNLPQLPGLGISDFDWLPGFTEAPACLGIWFVYVGFILGVITTTYYIYEGVRGKRMALTQEQSAADASSDSVSGSEDVRSRSSADESVSSQTKGGR